MFAKSFGRRLLLRSVKQRIHYKRLCEHRHSSLVQCTFERRGDELSFAWRRSLRCQPDKKEAGRRCRYAALTDSMATCQRPKATADGLVTRTTNRCLLPTKENAPRVRERAVRLAQLRRTRKMKKKKKSLSSTQGTRALFCSRTRMPILELQRKNTLTSPRILVPLNHVEPNRFSSRSCLARC